MPGDTVALVGGTGRFGLGLALRLAISGVDVCIGSRDSERAHDAALRIGGRLPAGEPVGAVTGGSNADICSRAEVVVLTLPYSALAATIDALAAELRARIVVSAVVPLQPGPDGPVPALPAEGSAAEMVAAALPEARVVSGFHTVSSAVLRDAAAEVAGDVILAGDDAGAKARVARLTAGIRGARPVDGGPLRNARYAEGIAILLLSINRLYRTHAGVTVTSLPDAAAVFA